MQKATFEIKRTKYLFNEVAEKKQPKIVSRIIKATLRHLNSIESEIKLIVPNYTRNGEMSELANGPLRDYVERLTTSFIQIESYFISMGSIDSNGNEHYSAKYPEITIPLDRVYSRGKWVEPVEEYNIHHQKQI